MRKYIKTCWIGKKNIFLYKALEEINKDHNNRATVLEFISTNILQNIYQNVTKTLQPRKIAKQVVDSIIQEITKTLEEKSLQANVVRFFLFIFKFCFFKYQTIKTYPPHTLCGW